MRVTTSNVEDFVENLRNAKSIYRRCVYFERSDKPLNGKTKYEATSFEIFYHASAVLEFEDGGQALVACCIICGVDRKTKDGGLDGSIARDKMHGWLKAYCDSCGLHLLPGVLDQ